MATARQLLGTRVRLLASMRIRLKLVVLHTCFSIALAVILALTLRPAITQVVEEAERHEAGVLLATVLAAPSDQQARAIQAVSGPGVVVQLGDAAGLSIPPELGVQARRGEPVFGPFTRDDGTRGVQAIGVCEDGRLIGVSVVLEKARAAVVRMYLIMTVALLAVYALVAIALEVFVLPQHVYGPIRTMLDAERAVQEGRTGAEIIPDRSIPADELGQIMRSRNQSILALRKKEQDLDHALKQLEEVAGDLKRKNHLLEMVRQNMADTDRLASLGLMSAGIAHELNTPLTVIKGLTEKLQNSTKSGKPSVTSDEAALMVRVVGRLEKLSESLLDFARARPPMSRAVSLRALVDEAWTLVRLDREAKEVEFSTDVSADLMLWCDGDRMVQVFVNLLRNAVDAICEHAARSGFESDRAGTIHFRAWSAPSGWTAMTIADSGPGLAPEVVPRLFQPFASTRMDSSGTGLGLAVVEGIIKEHGGVIVGRNRTDGQRGALFEIMLPDQPASGENSAG